MGHTYTVGSALTASILIKLFVRMLKFFKKKIFLKEIFVKENKTIYKKKILDFFFQNGIFKFN